MGKPPLPSPTIPQPTKLTPPQNQAQCNAATASVALATARAFVSLGLRDLGYTYINIDDCWSLRQRNATGHLVADPAKFSSGIDGLAREIHAMDLKLGLYGDAGLLTCASFPGSYGYEQQDADTIAAWGVDYWKYDNCLTEKPYTNLGIKSFEYYPIMRDALVKTGRPILYSICQWGRDEVWTWGGKVGNLWRVTEDITNEWRSVAGIAARAAGMSAWAGPGGFNDLDMMVSFLFLVAVSGFTDGHSNWGMGSSPRRRRGRILGCGRL